MTQPERDDEFEAFLKRRTVLPHGMSVDDRLQPPAALDEVVLRKAREAIHEQKQSQRVPRWAMPVAIAATILLCLSVVLNVSLNTNRPGLQLQRMTAANADKSAAGSPAEDVKEQQYVTVTGARRDAAAPSAVAAAPAEARRADAAVASTAAADTAGVGAAGGGPANGPAGAPVVSAQVPGSPPAPTVSARAPGSPPAPALARADSGGGRRRDQVAAGSVPSRESKTGPDAKLAAVQPPVLGGLDTLSAPAPMEPQADLASTAAAGAGLGSADAAKQIAGPAARSEARGGQPGEPALASAVPAAPLAPPPAPSSDTRTAAAESSSPSSVNDMQLQEVVTTAQRRPGRRSGSDAGSTAPATHPHDPKVWLKQIATLRTKGKTAQADAEMQRFRAAFPTYPVAQPDAPVSNP